MPYSPCQPLSPGFRGPGGSRAVPRRREGDRAVDVAGRWGQIGNRLLTVAGRIVNRLLTGRGRIGNRRADRGLIRR